MVRELADRATGAVLGGGNLKNGANRASGWFNQGVSLFRQGVQQGLYGVSFSEFQTGGTLEAPSRPNAVTDEDRTAARGALAANAAAETEALGRLGDLDRGRYRNVADRMGDRPVSRRALQSLLLDGQLTGSRDLQGRNTLLHNLDRLATQPLARGIDRAALLGEVTAEVENTVRIAQGNRNSCVATTASILLARTNQSEYARLVGGLASPGGSVRMAGGETLSRPDGWNAANDGDRTTSARLMQSSLLYHGAMLGSYDPAADTHRYGPLSMGGGLTGGGSARLNTQLQGRPYSTHTSTSLDRGSEWNLVTRALASGKGPFPVGLQWGSGGAHEVLLERMKGDWAIFTNPSGHRQRLSVDEFRSHLRNAEIPD